MYSISHAAELLGLRSDRARAWLDGYSRKGVDYPPVIREQSSGEDHVTWGEFVELGYLREYRRARVPLQHIRPVMQRLREEYGVRYPLAHSKPFVDGRELVLRIQEEEKLDSALAIVIRTGQGVMLSRPAASYFDKVEFDDDIAVRLRPAGKLSPVAIDPQRSYGRPSVSGVATERLAELIAAGDTVEFIAETYGLSPEHIRAAVSYETQQSATAA